MKRHPKEARLKKRKGKPLSADDLSFVITKEALSQARKRVRKSSAPATKVVQDKTKYTRKEKHKKPLL